MIQVKEMMQDEDHKNSKSKDKGSRSRSQSMNEQSHYKQDNTKTRQSINVKSHIFNVIGGTEEFEERDINIGGDFSQDIRDQLNAEAEAVQIILTGIDNAIYSTVDACPNACEMWKAIERLKQGESINVNVQFLLQLQPEWQRSQQSTKNRGKAIITSSAPTYDLEPDTITEDDEMSKDKEIDKLMALISLSFKKIYKPTNNNLRTSSNNSRANQDNSPRINKGTGYDNQRVVNVAGARENVGTPAVQKSGIQCYNCKEYGHVSRECQKPKRV
ncbi:retrovirus-related pol polyprotein from transposon TNT 1-94, partial [Tanacetum coccineum]